MNYKRVSFIYESKNHNIPLFNQSDSKTFAFFVEITPSHQTH